MMRYPKLFITIQDKRHRLPVPKGRDEKEVATQLTCPSCNDSNFYVSGRNGHIAQDDRAFEAEGHCCKCGNFVGVLRLEVSTLFGLREDKAVLEGRCRVELA